MRVRLTYSNLIYLNSYFTIRLVIITLFIFSTILLATKFTYDEDDLNDISSEFSNIQIEKYITTNYSDCNGLGNVMYRFASLYGIGRKIGRLPYFEKSLQCVRHYMDEIKYLFPNVYNTVQLLSSNKQEELYVDFALTCCEYEDPMRLANFTHKYLILKGNELQAYRYFNEYKNYIKEFFKCDQYLMTKLHQHALKIFKDDLSHKLCVHTRRGDMVYTGLQESQEDFVLASISYATKYLKKKQMAFNASVVLIGDDYQFKKNITKKLNTNYFILENLNRGQDLCLAIHYCDSLIISTGASTFGWWIGYLKKLEGPVFYNTQIIKPTNNRYLYYNKQRFDYEGFPKEWIRIALKNNSIVEDNKWFLEKDENKIENTNKLLRD